MDVSDQTTMPDQRRFVDFADDRLAVIGRQLARCALLAGVLERHQLAERIADRLETDSLFRPKFMRDLA